MALIWHPGLRNLIIGCGIMSQTSNNATGLTAALTIYSGVQPSAATIANNWANYNSTQSIFLAHFSGITFTQPNNGTFMTTSNYPTVTASNTGNGSWCILWVANPILSGMGTTTIPNVNFVVGPVSELVGGGIARFTTVDFTQGSSKTLGDASIGAI